MSRHVVFGTGQVGRHVVSTLVEGGQDVLAVNRSGRGDFPGARVAGGDVTDPVFAKEVTAGASTVYFCLNASNYHRWPEEFPPLQDSVLSAASAAAARLVVLENLYAYGPTGGAPMTEDTPTRPENAKGATRAAMTQQLLDAHARGEVEVTIGRAADLVGPGVTASSMGELVVGPAVAGKRAKTMGRPDTLHTYSYAPDVGRNLVLLGSQDDAYGRGVWHLPNPETLTTRQVITKIFDAAGTTPRITTLNRPMIRTVGLVSHDVRELLATYYQFDAPFIVDAIAFTAAFGGTVTSWDEIVSTTVASYRARGRHHDGVNPPDTVELRRGPEGSPAGLVEGWRGDRRIAIFLEEPTDTGVSFTLVGREAPIDPADVDGLLDALAARPGLALVTNDALLRDLARKHRFSGPLRGGLVPGPDGPIPWTDDPEGVRDAVQVLLPGIDIGVEASAGPARALLRRAVSGVSKTFVLLAGPDAAATPTRFSIPRRSDLLAESVARCIDTTIAIRRRFGRVASSARRVSFDHADFQLLHGNHAGSADRSSGLIHMNASFASIEGMTTMEQLRAQRGGGGSAGVAAPFNQIDGTTAHEIWHQMEGAVEARRSMDGIDLRRQLGEALGVETLEQAVNGARPRSPDAWKAAHARLVSEVSAYAATAPVEATAEMFKLWWCATGEPTPIVRRFGELAEPLLDGFTG